MMDFNVLVEKRHTVWKWSSILSGLLFQVVFFTEMIMYRDIVVLPPRRKLTYDYWIWYLDEYASVPGQEGIERAARMLGTVFLLILIACLISAFFSKELRGRIGSKRVIGAAVIGLVILVAVKCCIYFGAEHHRLFMDWVHVEVLSLVVLYYVWKYCKAKAIECS